MGRLPQAARILQRRRVPYELRRFDPAIRSAEQVATALGLPPEAVYKTLVLEGDTGRPVILMAPSTREVDLKRVASALGVKRLRMMAQRDAEGLTGMQTGAISAIPLVRRQFRILIADDALQRETILVSAGERGTDIQLSVQDIITVTGARAVPA